MSGPEVCCVIVLIHASMICVLTKAPASLSSRPEGWWWFCSRFLDKESADKGSVKQTDHQHETAQRFFQLYCLKKKCTQKPSAPVNI